MEIAKLGPAGLKARILRSFDSLPPVSTLRTGAADDASVLEVGDGRQAVTASAMMLEGVHFDLVYFPLRYLGFKAATKAVSHLVAMGARVEGLTVEVGLSQRFEVEDVEALMSGVREACQVYGSDLTGCHFASSRTGLTIATAAVGSVAEGRYLRSDTAQEHDLICVTGDLGAAFLGQAMLEREKQVFDRVGEDDFTPDFTGGEYILRRQMQPVARVDLSPSIIGEQIRPSAMTEVTEGLAGDLLRLCDLSGVGCRLYEERLPILDETRRMADRLGLDPTAIACNGGEDYELLFTLPLSDKESIEGLEGVTMVGFVTDKSMGCNLISSAGSETPLRSQGTTTDTDDNN